jgi:L-iduronidase
MQLRIHYLLDLLTVTAVNPMTYNWTQLDQAMDWLIVNRLSPGFEIMGSPGGGVFPAIAPAFWAGGGGFTANQTLGYFRTMVRDVIVHYSQRYGLAETTTWNWEGWCVTLPFIVACVST